ncbi:MAG: signal peptidase I [Clostridiales bacterium]|nr:signal peptidase I [Clostridiales bacterium]
MIKDSARWLLIPLTAVTAAFLINMFLIITAIVPSESMADTIDKGTIIVASRLAYKNKTPQRGDIVIFTHDELDAKYIVKRVIALPGESIRIEEGRVYINGSDSPLEESYVNEFSDDFFEETTVPDGSYFVLGDNRCHSYDSREWSEPFVLFGDIKAKACFKLFGKL